MSFCPDHQQKVVFYGSAFSELKNRKLCQKCIVNMNKNLLLIEDLEKQFSFVKLQYLKELQSKRNKNLDVLHSIKNYLQKERNQISDNMNIAITYIDTQVDLIKKVKEESQETFQISNNEDLYAFSKSICQETSIYKNIQVQLLQYIKNCNYTQLLDECKEILNQINVDDSKSQENVFKDLHMKYNQNIEPDDNNQWICEEHNDKIYYVDLNQPQVIPTRVACMKCVPQYLVKYETLDAMKKIWEDHTIQIQNLIEKKKNKFLNKQMGKAIENLQQVKDQICQLIDGCLLKIDLVNKNQNWIVKENRSLLKKDWQFLEKEDIIQIANILSDQKSEVTLDKEIESQCKQQLRLLQVDVESSYETILSIIRDQKLIFKDLIDVDVNQQILQPSVECNKQVQIDYLKDKQQKNSGQKILFNFVLLQENSYKEEQIYAIAFNEQATTMIAGKNKFIKIYQFEIGKLKFIQSLNLHKDKVTCLHFMKKSISFVSGAGDKLILIWESNDNEQTWKLQQQLEGHQGAISCLVLSKNENLMITGAADKKIIIWKKKNKWIHLQTLYHHQKEINSLSLNESENQLISCAIQENYIIISTQNHEDQLWLVVKYIQTSQWGLSLSFINDQLFTFYPYNQKVLELYQRQEGSKEFLKSKQITLQKANSSMTVFRQIFIKSQSVLVHQNGSQILLLKITEDFDFLIDNLIEFESDRIVGCVTPDLKYLVTWDEKSEQLQIRKLLEQQ